jgi:multidrug efflux pump subunit AcrB
MKLHEFALNNPWFIVVLTLLVLAAGGYQFMFRKAELFPDTVPPQVVVITVQPGSKADDVKRNITEVLEKELVTIPKLKKITSISRDGVSSIQLEFTYDKSIGQAVVDTQTTLARVKNQLPPNAKSPLVYQVTDATAPVVTLALYPKKGSHLTLSDIRILAKNDIKEYLLRIPGVNDIDIFGGNEKEFRVYLNWFKLRQYKVTPQMVMKAIKERNISQPASFIYEKNKEVMLQINGEFKNPREIKDLIIKRTKTGYVRVRDVARVEETIKDPRSIYHGNGKKSIAINILRAHGGNTPEVIRAVKKRIPVMKKMWPDIDVEITNDQEPVIIQNSKGMKSSLISSIIWTMIIIVLFLGNLRASLIVLVSIPTSFLFALVGLSLTDYSLNMVTLAALIISTGMVVDATVVVLENIETHREMTPDKPLKEIVLAAADEMALPIFSGMATTVSTLLPIMFVGGYVQKVLRPLSYVMISALVGSYLTAMALVPVLAYIFLRSSGKKSWFKVLIYPVTLTLNVMEDLYAFFLRLAIKVRIFVIIVAIIGVGLTIRTVIPYIGRDLMPEMDTGVVLISLSLPAQTVVSKVDEAMSKVEKIISEDKNVKMISSMAGSEPGQISFGGGGRTLQDIKITVNLNMRNQRKETIWQVVDKWRKAFRKLDMFESIQVSEYGATPISTTKAPIDVIVSGRRTELLDKLYVPLLKNFFGIKGLVDVSRSWRKDKLEGVIKIKPLQAKFYNLTSKQIADQLFLAVGGVPISGFKLDEFLDVPIRLSWEKMQDMDSLRRTDIYNPLGQVIPLSSVAEVKKSKTTSYITRENLKNTLDITGYVEGYRLSQVANQVQSAIDKIKLPAGYSIKLSGTYSDMMDAMKRVAKAVVIGIGLLLIVLVGSFNSFVLPFPVLVAIPLALIGSFWGLLIMDKPMCMPAMMGILLVAGTVINNSIFLIDFIENSRKKGLKREEAMVQSVRRRMRPIWMTTASTIVGMIPLILEQAVGLERLSPLGTVAAFGLAVGTIITLIVTPLFYSLLDDIKRFLTEW